MKCRDCEHWGWGDDEGTPVWGWCWIRTSCPDPDIERSCPAFSLKAPDIFTALSTLRTKNAQLRGELEYEQEHANAYHEECGQWEAENEKLRAELEQVKQERDEAVQCIRGIAKSGRVWMCPYCVHAKDTTGSIAECELDVGVCMMPYSRFEWRGQQKED